MLKHGGVLAENDTRAREGIKKGIVIVSKKTAFKPSEAFLLFRGAPADSLLILRVLQDRLN